MPARIIRSTVFLAIVACLLWSTAFAGIKIGLEYTTPLQFAGMRFFLAGLMIVPFCGGLRNYYRQVRANMKTILKVSMLQTFLLYGLFYIGIARVPGAITAIVVGASPLYATIVAHIFMKNDKVTVKKMIILLVGLGGVVIISFSGKGEEGFLMVQLWGILILVLSNISSALGNVLVSKQKKNMNPFIFNSAQIGLGGILLFFISIPIEGYTFEVYPLPYYFSLLWLSFLSASAFSIWFLLLSRPEVKVSDLNIWKFIIPVFGAFLSWMILPDESPDIFSLIGMLIIAVSLIMMSMTQYRYRDQREKAGL
jgi:drug/metabolite transporter (DMT)-like permease